jgi:hypothetical protein
MVFLAFSNAGTTGSIAGVNLHNARAQAVVTISSNGQMLWQIPHLTSHNSAVKVKYLENILLVSTPPCKLHLAEADVATHAKLRSADVVLVARSSSLRLTYTNYLNMRPNDVAIHKGTTRLNDIHDGDEGMILRTRLP